jgi:eukaryotic-like serine/threonine-protein kinase
MSLSPGTRLGPYEVVSVLGAGGMGQVYRARDTRLDRTVALKVLTDSAGEEATISILREARAAARLNHPHIAAIYDVVDTGDPPFLVMEYVDGEPLSSIVARGPLDPARAIDIGVALASALAYAHGQGIVHRDVKPSNVAVTSGGTLKLLDLGIARQLSSSALATTRKQTGSVGIMGTPAYMAPEQLVGRPATPRSDIYSAGVLLYELLTGKLPYPSDDVLVMMTALGSGRVPRVSSIRPDVPIGLDQVVARAMAVDPDERFASADDLKAALDAVRTTGRADLDTRRLTRVRRSRSLVAAVAAVLVAAVLGAWYFTRRPPPLGPAPVLVLPARNISGDPALDTLGAGLVSVVADNLSVASGLTIASAPASIGRDPGRDLRQLASEQGAGYAIALTLRPAASGVHVDAELMRVGTPTPVWQAADDGAPLDVERRIVEGLADALEWHGVLPRPLTGEESRLLRRLPTNNAKAFEEYSRARAVIDRQITRASVQQAIDGYRAAIQDDPEFGLAWAALSGAYGSMYNLTKEAAWIDQAADAADRAVAIDPNRSLVHISMSRVYRVAGRYEEAERHARIALALSPQSDDAHRELANVRFERHDLDGAIEELHTAITLRPNYSNTHALLGYMLIRSARYRDAIAPLTRATELNSQDANSFTLLGTAFEYVGDLQQAIGNYEHAMRLSPTAVTLSNLATAYYASGKFEDAAELYRQAIKQDPTSPTSHANLGDTYVRLGRSTDANAEYTEAATRARSKLQIKPGDSATIAILAMCEAKLGHADEAARLSAEALATAPDDVDVVYKAAVVAALAKQRDQALRQLQHALELGYAAAFAAADWDLRDLRTDAAFTALINRFTPK